MQMRNVYFANIPIAQIKRQKDIFVSVCLVSEDRSLTDRRV